MAAELGTINRIDNETMRAMVCAATAAGISYVMGVSVNKTAAAAALAGLGSAAAGDHPGGRLAYAAAWTGVIFFAPSAGLPYRMNIAEAGAALLGTLAGITLWSHSPTKNLDYAGKQTDKNDQKGNPIVIGKINAQLPALIRPLVGFVIGYLRPDWFSPARGALLAATSLASALVGNHLSQPLTNKRGQDLSFLQTTLLGLMVAQLVSKAVGVQLRNNTERFAIPLAIGGTSFLASQIWRHDKTGEEDGIE